jgi:hypothetical protein
MYAMNSPAHAADESLTFERRQHLARTGRYRSQHVCGTSGTSEVLPMLSTEPTLGTYYDCVDGRQKDQGCEGVLC